MERNYPPLKRAVRADVIRYNGRYSRKALIKLVLTRRTFRPIYSLRLCQHFSQSRNPLARIFHYWTTHNASIDFPWRIQLGEGFYINHGWGMVISPRSVIGRNVTLFHGVTLGQKDDITAEGRTTSYPTLADDVWVGPHVVIIGGVTVGEGSRLGGGAVIAKDVEPHTIVVGGGQRVVQENATPDVENRVPVEEFAD